MIRVDVGKEKKWNNYIDGALCYQHMLFMQEVIFKLRIEEIGVKTNGFSIRNVIL